MKIPMLSKGNPLSFLPAVAVLAAILWLTLSAHPMGDTDLALFPGADKAAHALMFGALACCLVIGCVSFSRPKKVMATAACAATASSLVGIGIEYAQEALAQGREFELLDIAADIAGALGGSALSVAAIKKSLFNKKGFDEHGQ